MGDSTDILADIMAEDAEYTPEPEETPVVTGGSVLWFKAKKFVLQALLERAQRVVPGTNTTLPILTNLLFELTDKRLRVVATDLERTIISSTEMVEVLAPGAACFPAKKILEIVRVADEGDAEIKAAKDGQAHIEIGRASWELKLHAGADFPMVQDVHDVELTQVDRVTLLNGIHAVRYAATKDVTRQPLRMIDVTNGKMTACDGVRFQQTMLGEDFPLTLKIPVGAIEDLVQMLKATDLPTIGVGEQEHSLVFKVGSDIFVVNKLMAQFPDVEQLLLRPALTNKHKLALDRQELVDAIKRVKINSDPETSAIALALSADRLTVRSKDKLGNEATETLDTAWTAGTRQLVVNHGFLLEMLAMHQGKSCLFFLGDDTRSRKSPLMLKDDDTGTIGVIQQMQSDWAGY